MENAPIIGLLGGIFVMLIGIHFRLQDIIHQLKDRKT